MKFNTGWFYGNGGTPREIRDVGFAPDAVMVKINNQRIICKTRSMTGTKSCIVGTTGVLTDAITELTARGFKLGADATVSTNAQLGQWWAWQYDTANCWGWSYVGNATSQDKVNPDSVTFVPVATLVFPEGLRTPYMRTNHMAANTSAPLNSGVLDTTSIKSHVAGGFNTGTAANVNANGEIFHVLMFAAQAGVCEILSFTPDGTDNYQVSGASFQHDAALFKVNLGTNAALDSWAYTSKEADSGATISGAWGTGFIRNRTTNGFQLGTDTHINSAGLATYLLAWKETVAPPAILTRPAGYKRSNGLVFDLTSPWNTKISPLAQVDPLTANYLRNLKGVVDGLGYAANVIGVDQAPTQGIPFAIADNTCPLVQLNPVGGATFTTTQIRWPRGAHPGNGADATLTIYDAVQDIFHDMWHVTESSETVKTAEFYRTFPNTIGYEPGNKASAVRSLGTPLAGGLIRIEEMRRGVIPHALVFGYGPHTLFDADGKCCGPAQYGYKRGMAADGVSFAMASSSATLDTCMDYRNNINCMPYGARMRLKPTVDIITLSDGNPRALVLAKALQDYGMYLGDGSGEFQIYAERPQYDSQQWDGLLSFYDARALTASAVLNTTYWDVMLLPTGWQTWP